MVLCGLDAPPWFCNRIWKSPHVISSSRYVRKERTRLYSSDPHSNIQYVRSKVSAGMKFRFGYVVDEVSTGKLRMETLDFSCKLPHYPMKEWCAANSCNGLVCLVNEPVWPGGTNDNSVVCVCNPILGEWISIPIPNRNSDCVCALGFSAKNNQYKILLCVKDGGKYTPREYEWKIYTLGTGHWRSIEAKETIEPWCNSYSIPFNTFIHGSLHWTSETDGPFVVQSFNFETERFTELSLPEIDSTVIGEFLSVTLGVINGCLWASFYNGMENDDCEMWAMKEYGDEKSWTMTLALRDDYYRKYDLPDEELLARHKELVMYKKHICYHKLLLTLNGEEMLVWEMDGRFSCYNIKTMRYRVARPTILAVSRRTIDAARQALRIGPVIAYDPSFVSLLHDVGKGEQVIRGEFLGKRDKFGGYKCADCSSPQYKSGTRFNSGCGWPAFFEGLPGAINRTNYEFNFEEDDGLAFQKDPDGWRTEISCRACGAPCVQRGGYT